MNKLGQAGIFGVMMFVFAFIVALIVVTPLNDLLDDIRDVNSLDCGNSSISTGTALTCVAVDLTLPFFIVTVILSGTGAMFFRLRGR